MEFSWPGEKLLIKLCDTVASKGIGSLLKPWQMRREGAAAAEVKRLNSLTLAQTKIEVADIQAGKKVLLPGGKLESAAGPAAEVEHASRVAIIAELDEIVKANVLNEAFRKEVSVAKAVLYAEQELRGDAQEPSDAPVSDDWLLRWRDNAASVSSDELQSLWGKVLAGEVKSPGSYSLRTLEFLRNLSQEEAQHIEKVSPFVINAAIYKGSAEMLAAVGVTSTVLRELGDLGILSGTDGLGLSLTGKSNRADRFENTIHTSDVALFVTHADASKAWTISVCTVTNLGKQILQLAKAKPDPAYLQAIANDIKNQGFEVSMSNYFVVGNQMFMPNLTPI